MKFTGFFRKLGVLAMSLLCSLAFAADPKFTTNEFNLDTELPGVKIYVRNTHLANQTKFTGD